MKLPKDAVMRLSVVNTMLRDKYCSLEAMAAAEGFDAGEIAAGLATIGYSYNPDTNRFV